MFARVSKFRMRPGLEAQIAPMLEFARSRLASIAGLNCSYTMWDDDGNTITFAIYDSEAAAAAAATKVREIWSGLAPFLEEPPEVTWYTDVHRLVGQ